MPADVAVASILRAADIRDWAATVAYWMLPQDTPGAVVVIVQGAMVTSAVKVPGPAMAAPSAIGGRHDSQARRRYDYILRQTDEPRCPGRGEKI